MEAPAISAVPKKKRLAIFLDGTWNDTSDNTNVWRLKALCSQKSADDVQQLAYYDKGVDGFFGGTFGKGLGDNIVQAYEWLVDNYNPGDDIFIFGFSRGAFTARAFAGLIAKHGVLKPGAPIGVGQLWERYKRPDDTTIWSLFEKEKKGELTNPTLEERRIMKYSQCVDIMMVGVWDTVGSLGVPMLSIPGISRKTLGFLHTGLRTMVLHCFHAIAIDEHRYSFNPTLWTVHQSKDGPVPTFRPLEKCEQRWFVGAHADVGGGCRNDILAQIPLRWLMKKASLLGLEFRNDIEIDGDFITAEVSDSHGEFLKGAYKYGSKPVNRVIGEPARPNEYTGGHDWPVNETIDVSVFERAQKNRKYQPVSLVEWAKRYKVDLKQVKTSIMAAKPDVVAPD